MKKGRDDSGGRKLEQEEDDEGDNEGKERRK